MSNKRQLNQMRRSLIFMIKSHYRTVFKDMDKLLDRLYGLLDNVSGSTAKRAVRKLLDDANNYNSALMSLEIIHMERAEKTLEPFKFYNPYTEELDKIHKKLKNYEGRYGK